MRTFCVSLSVLKSEASVASMVFVHCCSYYIFSQKREKEEKKKMQKGYFKVNCISDDGLGKKEILLLYIFSRFLLLILIGYVEKEPISWVNLSSGQRYIHTTAPSSSSPLIMCTATCREGRVPFLYRKVIYGNKKRSLAVYLIKKRNLYFPQDQKRIITRSFFPKRPKKLKMDKNSMFKKSITIKQMIWKKKEK